MPDRDMPDIQVDCVDTTVCPRCAATVDVSGGRAFQTARCPSCETEFPAPGKIGPYVLLKQLSLDETGATYSGFDTSMSRRVQVNVMRRALRHDTDKVGWFLAEARALAALDHRNAARAFYVGDEDGRPYSVTELIEGESLASVLAAGKPLKEVSLLELGVDIACVLVAASQRGVVHGDVRPGNIIITPQNVVKLVNFRFAGAGAKPPTANAPPIEAAYASPEHLGGGAIDSRSDVFSLGATLFHALTGCLPFDDDSPRARLAAPAPDALAACPTLHQRTADVLTGVLQADPDKRSGGKFPALLTGLRVALIASRKPKSGVVQIAEPVNPAVAASADAAEALAEMIEARQARPAPQVLVSAPREPDSRPAAPAQPPDAPVDSQGHSDPHERTAGGINMRDPATILVILALLIGLALGIWIIVFGPAPGATRGPTSRPASVPGGQNVLLAAIRSMGRPSAFRGKTGLGTWKTGAEFRNVRVTRGAGANRRSRRAAPSPACRACDPGQAPSASRYLRDVSSARFSAVRRSTARAVRRWR